MSIFDDLSSDSKKNIYKNSINVGDVFLKDSEEADHKKYLVKPSLLQIYLKSYISRIKFGI